MLPVVFWLAAGLVVYTYAGYPLLVWAWARWRPWTTAGSATISSLKLPTVSIVTVAQNESARIERRLDDLAGLDYPADLVEIIVASDGSTDDTVARARRREDALAALRVFELSPRRGKAAVLGEVAALARHEIIVLCDIRQRIPPDALRALVAPFADARVGVVSGTIVPAEDGHAVGRGLGAYWRYETFLRRCESAVDSAVGATGALYAIRNRLFEAPGADTLLDDMVIPMRAMRAGYRVVFEPRARAIEEEPGDPRHEWSRRVRTLAGCFQLFAHERWLLDPLRNRIWLQMVSHKALRLICPALLAVVLATSWLLGGSLIYRVALGAQIVFYALAGIGLIACRTRQSVVGFLFALPTTFVLLQAAVMVGMWRFFGHSQPVTWDRGAKLKLKPR